MAETLVTDDLGEALRQIAHDVDTCFDALLPVPQDARARLIEAMRYAAIGGGKRMRPLLCVTTAGISWRWRGACPTSMALSQEKCIGLRPIWAGQLVIRTSCMVH